LKLITFIQAIILYFGTLPTTLSSQSKTTKYVMEINTYIDFANENINGLLLLQRLFDYQNREVLESLGQEIGKVSIIDNKSLPSNLFEDPDAKFFEVSPNALYNQIKAHSSELPENYLITLDFIVDEMHYITNELNDLRFLTEELISDDLDDLESKRAIFDQFQKVENLLMSYLEIHVSLANIIDTMTAELKLESDLVEFHRFNTFADEIYFNNRDLIFSFYNKDLENLNAFILQNQKALLEIENLELYLPKHKDLHKIKDRTESISRNMRYLNEKTTIFESYDFDGNTEFLVYERYYAYYNHVLLPGFNKYGNGIASELNKVIDNYNIPVIKYLELPHYFKTIIPTIKVD
jgi:hypothetical protein